VWVGAGLGAVTLRGLGPLLRGALVGGFEGRLDDLLDGALGIGRGVAAGREPWLGRGDDVGRGAEALGRGAADGRGAAEGRGPAEGRGAEALGRGPAEGLLLGRCAASWPARRNSVASRKPGIRVSMGRSRRCTASRQATRIPAAQGPRWRWCGGFWPGRDLSQAGTGGAVPAARHGAFGRPRGTMAP
jgi:hypothetical protein